MEESPYLKSHPALRKKFESLPLIGALAAKEQQLVIVSSKIRRYNCGERLIYEGIYDPWVFILIQGSVLIEKSGQPLAELNQCGDIFGELCLIDKKTRSASVEALTDCVCLAIDTEHLQQSPKENRDQLMAVTYRLFAELLAERLRRTDEQLVELKQEANWHYSLNNPGA